jgi:aminopeptidase N
MDLSNPEQLKAMGAEVEKLASNDPKTLVQAAAISALAKTKDKKYLPVFEKGVNAVSNAVKGSSVSAIVEIDPSRAVYFS